jgi:type IV pilus assembly protein PilC
MLEAGVPLAQALEVLSRGAESESMDMVVTSILKRVEGGTQLSVAVSRFPRVFPQVFRSMVRVGEETGDLTGVLQSAASWMEADQRVYAQVKSAMTYPAFVAITAFVLTIALFTTVVPGLLDVLVQTNAKIPLLTRMVMAITRVATNPLSYLLPAGMLGMLLANSRRLAADQRFMGRVWETLLELPVVGDFLRTAAMSRYTCACQTLLSTGCMPTRAVDLAAEASGCALLQIDRDRILDTLHGGGQMSDAMAERPDLYDRRVIQFLQAGESSARIPDMLERAGTILTVELETMVDRLSSLIEPLLLFFIGSLVGTILIAIFLPLYASIQSV